MRRHSRRLACVCVGSCLLLASCSPPVDTTNGGQTNWTASLRATPAQMAGPDTWMKFEWGADRPVQVADSNFIIPAYTICRRDGSDWGEAVCYISLQKRDATVAHYTIKLRAEDGSEASTTIEVPVGQAANTAPHAHFGMTVSSVGIASGQEAAESPILFDATLSWDEQDGQTGLQTRWDFDGDGVFDTDWAGSLQVSHNYTRTEALKGTLQTAEPPSIPTYKLIVKMELRDTGGLVSSYNYDVTVSVYN